MESKDHALQAVRCAIALRKAVSDLNAHRARQGLMTVEVSIGVNTGSVIAGNMGSAGRKLDYTVIGADVNLAWRMAGMPLHGGEIWIGGSTLAEVKGHVRVKDLGLISFKGIDEPQRVYGVA